MPSELRIDALASECKSLRSDMDFVYRNVAPSFEFSNTGRRGGKKYFSITLVELLSTLEDIKANLSAYESAKNYNETDMRDLFSSTISSKTVNALSTVQTLPLFSLLNKFIYVSNSLDGRFDEKSLNISPELIDGSIAYLKSQLPDNDVYLESLSKTAPSAPGELEAGVNIIFYGAPGTGKSYKIDQQCTEENSIRTVFHPETQNSDFIGCLKPAMKGTDIVYGFRPGPLCLALKLAHSKPTENVYLVIEEINRAAAAAVFGEVFQLLDRAESGNSRYSITVSDTDMLSYLDSEAPSVIDHDKLRLPHNLHLYATMNSSDQAVMPMDTAFKRRWKFDYIPINLIEPEAGPDGVIPIVFAGRTEKDFQWRFFAECVNRILSENDIPEDRLLGPWFLSQEELKTREVALASLKGKLLLYLWDDVLRHTDRSVIFRSDIKVFSRLIEYIDSKQPVFSSKFEDTLVDILREYSKKAEVPSTQEDTNEDSESSDSVLIEEQPDA